MEIVNFKHLISKFENSTGWSVQQVNLKKNYFNPNKTHLIDYFFIVSHLRKDLLIFNVGKKTDPVKIVVLAPENLKNFIESFLPMFNLNMN